MEGKTVNTGEGVWGRGGRVDWKIRDKMNEWRALLWDKARFTSYSFPCTEPLWSPASFSVIIRTTRRQCVRCVRWHMRTQWMEGAGKNSQRGHLWFCPEQSVPVDLSLLDYHLTQWNEWTNISHFPDSAEIPLHHLICCCSLWNFLVKYLKAWYIFNSV